MTTKRTSLAAYSLSLAVFAPAVAAESEPEWPDWDLQERVAAVSDGELRLLAAGVPDRVHVHENQIRITVTSLDDGWVALDQCHENMDAVPAAQITFSPDRIRNLRIKSAVNIGRSWVQDHRVQLEDIGTGARLCVSAESRALMDLGDGYYRLRNGPYMRQFLDGYYPMRVRIHIRYPAETLEFIRSQPPIQAGFAIQSEPGRLGVNASFEGRLRTCMDFRTRGADNRPPPFLPCTGD